MGCGLRPALPAYLTIVRSWMADAWKANADPDIGDVAIVPQPSLDQIALLGDRVARGVFAHRASVCVLGAAEAKSLKLGGGESREAGFAGVGGRGGVR